MLTHRQLFLKHVAQTSDKPMMLEIERAEGMYMYDKSGKKYLDLISGISVSNLGHKNPDVIDAVKRQVDDYMHLMVYGEFVESPQVELAHLLASHLPESLNCTYFVNSGSEAIEGALKLAKRYTGKQELIAFKNSYHGSTHGALSLMSESRFKDPFLPLLPGVELLTFNSIEEIEAITEKTACVVVEPIQGEAGVILPKGDFLIELKKRCSEKGALLVFDEAQTGFGRTGSLFAFTQYGVVPDILVIAKAMGGGMPLGGFVASKEIMTCLTNDPALGHITTFGGHPVSCAAGLASLKTLLESNLIEEVAKKEELFLELLTHPRMISIRSKGLMISVELESTSINRKAIEKMMEGGVFVDWFLFADNCFRVAPPLIISEQEIRMACEVINDSLDGI